LRLRGKGIHHRRRGHETTGDQYVTLKVTIGASGDAELAKFLEEWAKTHPSDPRRAMGGDPHPGSADREAAS
jgi:DnaJ-class molecular chaperone